VADDPQPVGVPPDIPGANRNPSAETLHNQINNNDNHHVADDPQPVGVPTDHNQIDNNDYHHVADDPQPQINNNDNHHVADDPQPVGDPPLLDVAVDENIGNQANNNDNSDVMRTGLLDAAPVEFIDYQANNNDSHEVVDAPVGDVPDIAAVENIDNQEDTNNDNQDVVDAPVGNVTDRLFDVTANDNENIGIVANNEENHDVVDAPVDNVADIAEVAAVEIIAAAVETITDVQEHEYGRSSDITQINHQLQSIIQQLR
jgi:hypothetical protein